MSDRDDELEQARSDYEGGRLIRDVIEMNGWTILGALAGLLTGGPAGAIVGGSLAAGGSGAKSIADRRRRDEEWEGS